MNRSGGCWRMVTSAKVHVGQCGRDASLVSVMEASICSGCCRSTDASHHLWSHCPIKGKQLPWVLKRCSSLTQVSAILVQSESLASLHDHLELKIMLNFKGIEKRTEQCSMCSKFISMSLSVLCQVRDGIKTRENEIGKTSSPVFVRNLGATWLVGLLVRFELSLV